MKQEFKTKNSNYLLRSKNYNKHVGIDFMRAHNKGITLIVLIITIIVLLILSVITITSIKSNILKYAQDEEEKYSLLEEIERVTLAVHKGIVSSQGALDKDGLIIGMNTQFTNTGWEKVDWDESDEYARVLITTSKRQYKINLDTGKIEDEKYPGLKIGDKVNYTVDGYTGDWRVLDIDGDQVKLVASSNTEDFEMPRGNSTLLIWDDNTESYKNAENKLDEICKKYINETYATDARSIKVEDIDKKTKYDKTQYGIGELNQYGNKVTYTITENSNNRVTDVSYESTVKTGKALTPFTAFRKPLAEINNNITKPYAVTSSTYTYSLSDINYTDKASNVYKMLFGSDIYWLASSYVHPRESDIVYGLYQWEKEYLNAYMAWMSSEEKAVDEVAYSGNYTIAGIRPVVTLKSDIKLTQTSENSGEWNISK